MEREHSMSDNDDNTAVEISDTPPPRKITIGSWSFSLPESRPVRVAMGVGLCVLGVFGFLPILGFWMIPLGLVILSYEFAAVRRFRRRVVVWWERRRQTKAERARQKP